MRAFAPHQPGVRPSRFCFKLASAAVGQPVATQPLRCTGNCTIAAAGHHVLLASAATALLLQPLQEQRTVSPMHMHAGPWSRQPLLLGMRHAVLLSGNLQSCACTAEQHECTAPLAARAAAACAQQHNRQPITWCGCSLCRACTQLSASRPACITALIACGHEWHAWQPSSTPSNWRTAHPEHTHSHNSTPPVVNAANHGVSSLGRAVSYLAAPQCRHVVLLCAGAPVGL
jgi:hypothetical protein